MINNFIEIINNYDIKNLKYDLMAGISVGAVTLPQSMAYALIIGINPIYGLYTSIISMIIATFFGVSNYLIVGPTNMMAIVIASSLSNYQPEHYLQLVFLLTFLIGLIQLILGVLKLGNLVNYVSHPVIVGLTTGVSLIIGVGQLNNFLGMAVSDGVNLVVTLYKIIIQLGEVNYYSVVMGLLTLAIIVITDNINSKFPSYLISIIMSVLIVYLFNLSNNLEVVSEFTLSLPVFNLPVLSDFSLIKNLLSSAFSIAILGFIQVVSIIKSLEKRTKEEVELNKEFIGQGIINIVGSFLNCFAVTGSFTRSFVNYEAGARTRISEFITSLFLILFIFLFVPFVKYIPISSLAAIVIMAAYNMVDIENIIESFKTTQFDAVILVVTFITTILLPRIDYAIYFGIFISILLVLRNTSDIDYSHIDYEEEKEDEFLSQSLQDVQENNCIVINIGGNIHFHSSENLKKELNDSFMQEKTFIIRMREIENIDITSLKELDKFIDKVHDSKGTVLLSGINQKLYKALKESGIINKVDEKNIYKASDYIFSSTKEAIEETQNNETHIKDSNDGNE
jgi:SulP family sulfate permease